MTSAIQKYHVPTQLPIGMFRAYDIRGEVSENGLSENVAYALGLAVGSEALSVSQTAIIVACDARLSGPSMKAALTAGIIETGCDVVDISVGPTPMVYFATNVLQTQTGVMVTASHNPSHHNGFKVVLKGKTLSSDGIQKLLKRIQEKAFVSGKGQVRFENIIPAYMDAICDRITLAKPMKVVIDAGNGAASEIAPIVFRRLGCEVIELFCEYDGRFPNHHPDPTIPDNLQALIEAVKKEKADIGLAFDGDADRLGVVTNEGEIIWPDRQLMLYAKSVLEKHPGEKIVFDVKCSRLLAEAIKQAGGIPVMYKTGHSILKEKMLAEKAPLAGEMSGHIFFNDDWYGFDDGIYVAARLLSILSRENRSVSGVFHAQPKTVNTPELKLPISEDEKAAFLIRLINEADFEGAEIITIDGLRVEWPFGWGLIRASNTSPCFTMRFEADDDVHLERIQHIFRMQLLKIEDSLQLPF